MPYGLSEIPGLLPRARSQKQVFLYIQVAQKSPGFSGPTLVVRQRLSFKPLPSNSFRKEVASLPQKWSVSANAGLEPFPTTLLLYSWAIKYLIQKSSIFNYRQIAFFSIFIEFENNFSHCTCTWALNMTVLDVFTAIRNSFMTILQWINILWMTAAYYSLIIIAKKCNKSFIITRWGNEEKLLCFKILAFFFFEVKDATLQ